VRGFFRFPSATLWLAVAAAAQLGACAYPQSRNEVRVRVGLAAEEARRAEPFASLYLPYAMMSSLAYTRPEKSNADLCPDPALLDRQSDAAAIAWIGALHARKWHCVFGLAEKQACPRRYPDCRPLDVPDLLVWKRSDPACSEIVIAYRGLNLRDPGDWLNLRWAVRLARADDYQRIEAHVDGIIGKAGCRGAHIIAAGHSLGGGYAEKAAHANGRIRYVYAFNSYPVSGLIDPDPAARERNKVGLGIDDVYEAGEILTIPRLLITGLASSDCNPRIRLVRFNMIPIGLPVEKHQIDTLTFNMAELSARGAASAKSAMGYADAWRCAQAAPRLKV
jgi:hypothetical protein